jgi:hypothetical protein
VTIILTTKVSHMVSLVISKLRGSEVVDALMSPTHVESDALTGFELDTRSPGTNLQAHDFSSWYLLYLVHGVVRPILVH